MSAPSFDLFAELDTLCRQHPAAAHLAGQFRHLHERSDPDPYGRGGDGHFTGSAFVVSGDGLRTALMLHRKLDRWLQPGGHADGDRDLRRVALREAGEETGLAGLQVASRIFDLDRHWIPERPGEPGHWHYDVRFVVRAGQDETLCGNVESKALAWHRIDAIAVGKEIDGSLSRMARRWLDDVTSGASGAPCLPPGVPV